MKKVRLGHTIIDFTSQFFCADLLNRVGKNTIRVDPHFSEIFFKGRIVLQAVS